jgi:hypothetical protein
MGKRKRDRQNGRGGGTKDNKKQKTNTDFYSYIFKLSLA